MLGGLGCSEAQAEGLISPLELRKTGKTDVAAYGSERGSAMKRLVVLCALILFGCQLLAAETAKLLRHPSYHDGKIAFSYLGDIWIVSEKGGQPARLTVHTARDVYPRFSPDGKWVAFSSNRFGNYDVFLMLSGGRPALGYRAGSG